MEGTTQKYFLSSRFITFPRLQFSRIHLPSPSLASSSATMSTSFSSLPIISISAFSSSSPKPEELINLAARLDDVFATTGFAYFTDLPLTYTHEDVFGLYNEFFGAQGLSTEDKMKLAKKTFVQTNVNTYRGLADRRPFILP